jgi:hypothetical protein
MVVTLPLPASRFPPHGRLTLARSGGTFWWALWRERRCGDWNQPDDGPGDAGVREPRRPIPPRWGGSVAPPLDR